MELMMIAVSCRRTVFLLWLPVVVQIGQGGLITAQQPQTASNVP